MNKENKYFWGLFILCGITIFLLIKEKVQIFYWMVLGVFLYLVFKNKIKEVIGRI